MATTLCAGSENSLVVLRPATRPRERAARVNIFLMAKEAYPVAMIYRSDVMQCVRSLLADEHGQTRQTLITLLCCPSPLSSPILSTLSLNPIASVE